MSLASLRAPRTQRSCVACKAYVAECMVPVGEGSAAMCWLCAHHVVDHETPVHEAMTAECECTPDKIYPVRVLQQRAAAGLEMPYFTNGTYVEKPQYVGRHSKRWDDMKKHADEQLQHIKCTDHSGIDELDTGPIAVPTARRFRC